MALPNPNNPTGTYVPDSELIPFLVEVEKVRDGGVHVILDYAYWEYVTAKDMSDPMDLFRKFKNISVLKTFSKVYGLGGLRVGYGVMQESLAKYVQKVRMPFNVSSIGLIGAEAALTDKAFVKKSLQTNKVGLKTMMKAYKKLGVPFLPSQGNFLLINTREGFGLTGGEVFEACLRKGLILRPVTNYGLADWIRVTIGTDAQNQFAIKVLTGIKKAQAV